jgi:hypothetical protein
MIQKTTILTGALFSMFFAVACDKAADDQKKVDNAQAVASDKVTAANVEANQKIAAARAEETDKVAAAQGDFGKMREDYRHSTATDLADVDQKMSNLDAKERQATGDDKANLDARLREIRASRAAFAADYRSLDAASAATWDDTKARLDKEMSDLKALVNKA